MHFTKYEFAVEKVIMKIKFKIGQSFYRVRHPNYIFCK